MSVKIVRSELLKVIKEVNGLEIAKKLFTKDVEDFELLIKFLELIESIPEDSEEEEKLSQDVVKYYNRMARLVEEMDKSALIAATEAPDEKIKKKKSAQVEDVESFIDKDPHIPTKTKMIQVTDLLDGLDEDDKKDILGMKLDGKNHKIISKLVSGKSEGFVVKKGIAEDKSEIASAIGFLQKKHGDSIEIKKSKADDGKIYYKIFVKKSVLKK